MTDIEIFERFEAEALQHRIDELENKLNSEVRSIERSVNALERRTAEMQNDISDLERKQ